MIWPRSHMCLEALPSSHLVPAPQIRAHDFWRYINLYSRMYVCRSLLGRGGRLLYVEHLLSSAVPGLACVLVASNHRQLISPAANHYTSSPISDAHLFLERCK